MKRLVLLVIVFLSTIILTSCTSQSSETKFNRDLTRETWMQGIETDPMPWTSGADNWFLSGDAHAVEGPCPTAPSMSSMKFNASPFTSINVQGDFKVQIFGTTGPDSVYVYGPGPGVSDTLVHVRGDTLYIIQRPKTTFRMYTVLIRIGVHHLNHVVQRGRGIIEGIRLGSNCLTVTSTGSGNVYLAGHMNVTNINNLGSGSINIFGANTPQLDIVNAGCGSTNVMGNVGIHSIRHSGSGNINIIGANSDNLSIITEGRGKISISGIVNLCSVKAGGYTCVFVERVHSRNITVNASEQARVGLAGFANNVYFDASRFGTIHARNLCTDTAYVHTVEQAHVNVAAGKKIFATAGNTSSIYFYGSRDILTRFVTENGFVMQMCSATNSCPIVRTVAAAYPAEPILRMKGAG